MRGLSSSFMNDLFDGHLNILLKTTHQDKDLDMQIRDDYINIYYKGNSLLKLSKKSQGSYEVEMDEKFKGDLDLPDRLSAERETKKFVKNIPLIKENIINYDKKSFLEREYEQLIIRANNLETEIENGYFIVDRQYRKDGEEVDNEKDDKDNNIFDLTGFYWKLNGRRRGQTVPLSFMELKYATSSDIKNLPSQIKQYYNIVAKDPRKISEEAEKIFKQKLELKLLNQKNKRIEDLKTLKFSKDINEFQFIIILIDYNPGSDYLIGVKDELKEELSFSNQIKIFNVGLALWEKRMEVLN